MESQAVSRRINTISGHLGAGIVTEDVTAPTTHLFPLNCSSNLSISTPFRRLDSRLHYGRQASASQGSFMRQAVSSVEQNCSSNLTNLSTPFKRLDSRLHYGRQASASQGSFMRQASSSTEQGNSARSGGGCGNNAKEEKSLAPMPPLFSRPGTAEPLFARPEAEFNCNNVGVIESFAQDKMLPSSQCTNFTRSVEETSEAKPFSSRRQMLPPQNKEMEWSPRLNVAESRSSYIVTVELPGVDIRDIRIEMDDKNLTVRGKRSMKWWTAAGPSNDSLATYHKREISQGPYQVVWPLPAGANKDSVYAEFAYV